MLATIPLFELSNTLITQQKTRVHLSYNPFITWGAFAPFLSDVSRLLVKLSFNPTIPLFKLSNTLITRQKTRAHLAYNLSPLYKITAFLRYLFAQCRLCRVTRMSRHVYFSYFLFYRQCPLFYNKAAYLLFFATLLGGAAFGA